MSSNYQVRTVFCNDQEPLARFEDRGLAAAMYAHDLRKMFERVVHKDGSHIIEVRYIDVINNPRNAFDQTVLVTSTGRIPCQHRPKNN